MLSEKSTAKSKHFSYLVQYSGMKQRFFFGIALFLALLSGCEGGPSRSSCRPVLPATPTNWQEILGEPHWRLEWLDEAGAWQDWEGPPGYEAPDISPPCEWATAVLAWPFWPELNLAPGVMRPSGALFPWDASGEKLILSWMGGVEAFFWKELAQADRSSPAEDGRLPWYFDWPRFRGLFESGDIPETVHQDPWLADWKEIGRKTVQSGFDRRRIVARKCTQINIPGLGGPWAGSSPFSPPLHAPQGGPLSLEVSDTVDTWVSPDAVLKCSTGGWVLRGR